jgi:glycosyltransferase involved in cell wall biosynthesis
VRPAVEVSVVCPFYNEADGIERAAQQMVAQLERLEGEWELILVNDGSTDASPELAARIAASHTGVRVVGYTKNRGRGFALRTGMAAARGDIVVTTELDLSWGETIVEELVRFLRENRMFEIAVASPHLPGGGYRNVPTVRVWLSRLGNFFIRASLPGALTMNTGMTRAYRRRVLFALPLHEDGKEFHVEVIAKARALGLGIVEVPAQLTWHDPQRALRKSRRSLMEMALSHIWFVIRASPGQFVCLVGLAALLAAFGALVGEHMLLLQAPGADQSYAAATALFRLSLVLLAFSLPLAWLDRRLRRRWSRESEAMMAELPASEQLAARTIPRA